MKPTEEPIAIDFNPERHMMELFERVPLAERVRRVIHGIREPHESGAYKHARLELLRLLSPASAVVVPILVLLLLMALTAWVKPDRTEGIGVTYVERPEAPPDLDPITPIELTRTDFDNAVDTSFVNADVLPGSPTVQPEPVAKTATLPDLAPVAVIKTPFVLRGFYSSRTLGARVRGVGAGGGGAADAVLRALRWLQRHQESDGSWRAESGGPLPGAHGMGCAPAMTGLAVLTFLAHGETPASGEFGATVERAIRWLVADQEADGRFRGRDVHNYSHPIAVYALCEAFGMTGVPAVREAAERGLERIVRGQHASGAWDYDCGPGTRDDLSYSGWCVQALKAARIAGLSPAGLEDALRRAVAGVRQHATNAGAFGYTGPGETPLTAVGVLCLQLLHEADSATVRHGLAWLQRATCDWQAPWGRNPLYYWYYVTQAKYHAGGRDWEAWNRCFAPALSDNQTVVKGAGVDGKDIGYWKSASTSEQCQSYVYNTTLCALTLQVYYRSGPGRGLATYELTDPPADDTLASPRDVIPRITFDGPAA